MRNNEKVVTENGSKVPEYEIFAFVPNFREITHLI
jgi:hypothetical protein